MSRKKDDKKILLGDTKQSRFGVNQIIDPHLAEHDNIVGKKEKTQFLDDIVDAMKAAGYTFEKNGKALTSRMEKDFIRRRFNQLRNKAYPIIDSYKDGGDVQDVMEVLMEDDNIVIAEEADDHLRAFILRRFKELDEKVSSVPNLIHHFQRLSVENASKNTTTNVTPRRDEAQDLLFYEPEPQTDPPVIGIHIAPPDFDDDGMTFVPKKNLVKLDQILASTEVLGYMAERANDEKDESAMWVNDDYVRLFLCVREPKAYLGLKKFYSPGDKALFIKPDLLVKQVVEGQVFPQEESLRDYSCNVSILVSHGVEAQPACCYPQIPNQLPEKIGIFMLSANSPGTILYNMDGVPDPPTMADLRECLGPSVPKTIEVAAEWLSSIGRIFFATRDRRVERGVVEQFSVSLFDTANPHCAPRSKGHRAVLFLTFQPPGTETACDGYAPYSRQRFIFELMQEAHRQQDVDFLGEKYVEYVRESALLHGAIDPAVPLEPDKAKKFLAAHYRWLNRRHLLKQRAKADQEWEVGCAADNQAFEDYRRSLDQAASAEE